MKHVIIFSGALDNVGDLALLQSCVEGLRRQSDFAFAQIWSYCWGDVPETAKMALERMDVAPISGKSIKPYTLLGPDTLLLWGGGQLLRNNASNNSLRAAEALSRLAILTGAKTAVIGCGVSELSADKVKRYRRIFKNADLFAVREDFSVVGAAPLLKKVKPVVTQDLAFSFGALWEPYTADSNRTSLLVAPCEDDSEQRTVDDEQILQLILAAKHRYPNLATEFISHDVRPHMDPAVCQKLSIALSQKDISSTQNSSLILSEVLRTYERSHLVVTNRMHAAIFAYARGCAVIIVDDGNPKTRAIAKKLGLVTVPVSETNRSKLEDAIDRAEKVKASTTRRDTLDKMRATSESNFDLLRKAVRKESTNTILEDLTSA
ncbi:polysaccharide pyruvyl transferase family protein [Pseudooceanicola sp. C21-150M6]|uniref:polysaccharide pyruvyl transferase family protein n=1 Tax=Pseudooceanicola sp. C21-150M6 TaxID=3434355 RepID=UPI003D7FADB5